MCTHFIVFLIVAHKWSTLFPSFQKSVETATACYFLNAKLPGYEHSGGWSSRVIGIDAPFLVKIGMFLTMASSSSLSMEYLGALEFNVRILIPKLQCSDHFVLCGDNNR